MVEINQLNQNQRNILDLITRGSPKKHWVAGYAGTGKTIVITHALKKIAKASPRQKVCLLAYTHALKNLIESGLSESERSRVTIRTLDSMNRADKTYDWVFVDEVQDITERHLKKVLESADKFIFAGDPDQSIYAGRVDPEDLERSLGSYKKHVLRDVFRLGKNMLEITKHILPEAEIERGASLHNHDEHIIYKFQASNKDKEFREVLKQAQRVSRNGVPSAILFPTHELIYRFGEVAGLELCGKRPPPSVERGPIIDYSEFNKFFEERNSPIQYLGNDNGSFSDSDWRSIVYLMTYHSAKGLDFDNVFLPHLNDEVKLDAKAPNFSRLKEERRHFFVALTRSRRAVYLSYHGTPHWILDRIPDSLMETFLPPAQRGFR